jgi:hypothetical protein
VPQGNAHKDVLLLLFDFFLRHGICYWSLDVLVKKAGQEVRSTSSPTLSLTTDYLVMASVSRVDVLYHMA